MITPGSLLPVSFVAKILACTPNHVRMLIKRQDIEAVRIGNGKKDYRVIRASLVKFLETHKIDVEDFYE